MANDKISKVVDQIKQLAQQDSQFAGEMQKLFGKVVVSASVFPKEDKKVDSIYELCIKRIINEQAEKFYSNFPLKEIKDKLIGHFVQMENFKRWDDFDHFCEAAFQQIELIVSYMCRQEFFKNKFNNEYDSYPFTLGKNKVTLGDFVIVKLSKDKPNRNLETLCMQSKWRYILTTINYPEPSQKDGKVYYNSFTIDAESDRIYDLYQRRNSSAHPDIKPDEKQRQIHNKIKEAMGRYYLKFSAVLVTFIDEIYSYFEKHPEVLQQSSFYSKNAQVECSESF